MRPLDPVAWREHKDLLGECLSASVTSYVLNHGVGEREIVVHLTAASANAVAASQASPMTGTSRGSSERPGSKTLTMMNGLFGSGISSHAVLRAVRTCRRWAKPTPETNPIQQPEC
jgi:hypothetical protein